KPYNTSSESMPPVYRGAHIFMVSPKGQLVLRDMGVEMKAVLTHEFPDHDFNGIWKRVEPRSHVKIFGGLELVDDVLSHAHKMERKEKNLAQQVKASTDNSSCHSR
ncbi:MAG: hypothetical protein ACOYNL_04885, partial [Rickettsiales bacterium]